MANPQKENGYTAIANELIEAFMRLNLSQHSWRILFCVIRYSYGWNKKSASLTCTQISRLTGIDVRLVPRTLRNLLGKNVIVREKNSFKLQKDYSRWLSSAVMKVSSVQMSSVVMKNIISSDEHSSSAEMKHRGKKRKNVKGLRAPKDIPKDNYKDISLRERVFSELKKHFPKLRIPASVPTERMDYLLYLIQSGGIKPERIDSPVPYMMSSKLVIEPFPSLFEREEEAKRKKAEELEKAKRDRDEFRKKKLTREDITGDEELMEEVNSLKNRLGMKNEVVGV